jgi:hypothetical protein
MSTKVLVFSMFSMPSMMNWIRHSLTGIAAVRGNAGAVRFVSTVNRYLPAWKRLKII